MDAKTFSLDQLQPALFDWADVSTGAVELFPAVWGAAEDLTAPDLVTRSAALERLSELGAPRLSPLVAYLLATRLSEPDLALRARVVRSLGDVLQPDSQQRSTPEPVRRRVAAVLAQLRTRLVLSLLEVGAVYVDTRPHLARLLNAAPQAGEHLATLLADRSVPLPVRQQAAYFIGLVGYLEAQPTLTRLATRLEARLAGQQAMPFAPPPDQQDETTLLPAVQEALRLLRAS
jgi:HEAT repeat protein